MTRHSRQSLRRQGFVLAVARKASVREGQHPSVLVEVGEALIALGGA